MDAMTDCGKEMLSVEGVRQGEVEREEDMIEERQRKMVKDMKSKVNREVCHYRQKEW